MILAVENGIEFEIVEIEKIQVRTYGVLNIIDTDGNSYFSTDVTLKGVKEINKTCLVLVCDGDVFIVNREAYKHYLPKK